MARGRLWKRSVKCTWCCTLHNCVSWALYLKWSKYNVDQCKSKYLNLGTQWVHVTLLAALGVYKSNSYKKLPLQWTVTHLPACWQPCPRPDLRRLAAGPGGAEGGGQGLCVWQVWQSSHHNQHCLQCSSKLYFVICIVSASVTGKGKYLAKILAKVCWPFLELFVNTSQEIK